MSEPVPRRLVVLNPNLPRTAAEQRLLEGKIRRSHGWAIDAGWAVEVWGIGRRKPPSDAPPFEGGIRCRGPRLSSSRLLVRTVIANATFLALMVLHPRAGVLMGVGGIDTLGAALGIRLTRRRSRLAVTVNVHSAGDSLRRRGHQGAARALREIERFVFRSADLVVTVGSSTTEFVQELGVSEDRIIQISRRAAGQSDGSDTQAVAPSSSARDPRLIVCAARLEPRKAVDVLLGAMVTVRSRVHDARLEIAGSGSQLPELEGFVREQGLEGAVTFRGRVKRRDMPAFYRRAGVFVLPSRGDEGLPKVVVEAALAGCAVVGTDVRGTTELITAGVSGEVVPPDDADALADAITRLLADPSRAMKLAEKAQEIALAHQAGNTRSHDELHERLARFTRCAPPS